MKNFKYLPLVFIFVVSCEDPTALEVAWDEFENGEYENAHASFSALAPEVGALIGLGWTTLRMDSVEASRQYFIFAATETDPDTVEDLYAGWSLASWKLHEFSSAIQKSEIVLRNSPGYVFSHDRSITRHDLLLHAAYAHFHLANYSACAGLVHELNPLFPPTNTDPTVLLNEMESLFAQFD